MFDTKLQHTWWKFTALSVGALALACPLDTNTATAPTYSYAKSLMVVRMAIFTVPHMSFQSWKPLAAFDFDLALARMAAKPPRRFGRGFADTVARSDATARSTKTLTGMPLVPTNTPRSMDAILCLSMSAGVRHRIFPPQPHSAYSRSRQAIPLLLEVVHRRLLAKRDKFIPPDTYTATNIQRHTHSATIVSTCGGCVERAGMEQAAVPSTIAGGSARPLPSSSTLGWLP